MFHLVSLSLQISLTDLPGPCLGLCVGDACFVVLGCFVVGFFLLGKFDLNHMLIPVVDRPCLALVRQCRRKKKKVTPRLLSHLFSLTAESPIKTRCIDDRLSFKRARHRQKKKDQTYFSQ